MLMLDSSFIINLFNANEKNHEKANEMIDIFGINEQPKAINNIILNEVLNKLNKPYYNDKREKIINFLLSMDKIYFLSIEDYINAIAEYKKYNYFINYSDWLIILTMRKENIDTIVSFDSDFNKIKDINNIYI